MNLDLFCHAEDLAPWAEVICPGAVVLRNFALPMAADLLAEIDWITATAPFRQMLTPSGQRMSAALSSCGSAGWISDSKGYRYSPLDPLTDTPWPAMPDAFLTLARQAATAAGFAHFEPDACLINRYAIGSRMGLHQDKNEPDLTAPIVSVSLGLPATFLFGGLQRKDWPRRIPLQHGDVVIWGGSARLNFHGIQAIKEGIHPLTGEYRINLTFRQAQR